MDLIDVRSFRCASTRDDLALAHGERLLAGGTWLFSERQVGTTGLVDLTTMGWPAWSSTSAGVSISATCTIRDLQAIPAEAMGSAGRLVAAAADMMTMSFKIQQTATVGGNLCTALPAGAMAAAFTAMDATAVVWTVGGGERELPVADLVLGVGKSALAPGEVLRSVEIPASARSSREAFGRDSLATLGRSAAVVFATSRPGVTVFSLTASTTRPVVLRFPDVPDADDLDAAVNAVDCWFTDSHGSLEWRVAMTRRIAEECRRELEST